MHLGKAFGELALLDLVFEGHFDELLVVVFVVFGHLLQVELGAHELYFRLVEGDQFLAQFLRLLAVDLLMVKKMNRRVAVLCFAVICLLAQSLFCVVLLQAVFAFIVFELLVLIILSL